MRRWILALLLIWQELFDSRLLRMHDDITQSRNHYMKRLSCNTPVIHQRNGH